MDATHLRRLVVQRFALRVEPEMSDYLLRRMIAPDGASTVPVIGGDARTGVSVRKMIPLDQLRDEALAASSAMA
ncbi:MAG: hypothetical protein ACREIT_07350 [Tepidisphaeraceae bacterium]